MTPELVFDRLRDPFLLYFIGPVQDSAEFPDVGIAQGYQGFRCQLAAPSAAAVNKDQLILVISTSSAFSSILSWEITMAPGM